ncbi:sulfite exporter TauE/SafE family protein [Mesoterricola silvestris]|uniref:Probable membrane transporter protein n=1 Tax=Mesoterricola silvestris TaxID=2927979 RepID=A0AA48KBD2_9BACT|nr:sulfite exporter TauE/SafE family protein [Mesoterricola silvestris]BDU74960.1 hypothetical protein METEAL_41340 [Mesoterricola silvestris]
MAGTWVMAAGSLAAGLCGGILSGLFGIGGGIILIPMLGLLLGLSQHQAQGVTLAAMLLPNGLPAVLHFRKQGIRIHWPLVVFLTAAFLPGVWAGARLASHIPDGPLRTVFGVFLAILALRTWFQKPAAAGRETRVPSAREMLLPGLGIGLAAGTLSGLLGIGGGIVIIPFLVWSLDLSQHEAQAACLAFMLAPIGLPGVLVYARHQGGLPWLIMGGVAVGFLCGAYGGARIATRLNAPRLRRAFAILMACVAVLMLF